MIFYVGDWMGDVSGWVSCVVGIIVCYFVEG